MCVSYICINYAEALRAQILILVHSERTFRTICTLKSCDVHVNIFIPSYFEHIILSNLVISIFKSQNYGGAI